MSDDITSSPPLPSRDILAEIASKTRERIEAQKRVVSLDALRKRVIVEAHYVPYWTGRRQDNTTTGFDFPFEAALRGEPLSFICEIKKASPSKGIIDEEFAYLDIARAYEAAGAAALSVLTEPHYFEGANRYLAEIAEVVSIPILRKDFVIDEYMIYEAKALGADAVLLIVGLLDQSELEHFIRVAHSIGLSALVETRDEEEVERALTAGARIIGVNNRDLRTFEVDLATSERLRDLVPRDVLFVSESGISTPEDIARLRDLGVDAVLIGEALMRSDNKKTALAALSSLCVPPLDMSLDRITPRVKICGLSRIEDIEAVNAARPAYVGFVFAPSPRRVTVEKARALRAQLDTGIKAVGVFVDQRIDDIAYLAEHGIIDMIQLHGNEDGRYIGDLRQCTDKPIIKAVTVTHVGAAQQWDSGIVDYLLLDGPRAGSGTAFDHALIGELKTPYFLAGGLDELNVGEALGYCSPHAVDVSSGVETDGVKDPAKINMFIKKVGTGRQYRPCKEHSNG